MADIVIRVERLGKKYRLKEQVRYLTLRDAVMNFVKRSNFFSKSGNNFFWALRGISFQVARGEIAGIVGANGAGKSTLLKILSGIIEPTEGSAKISGRCGALLEVGTGFHHELSGRENVYFYGAILGMKTFEIKRKFDQIVAFAEVEKFIDMPVKFFSTGMYLRLAFAVAAHLETEILLVDEALAVGDAAFQKRCLGKMDALAKEGRTVLFVSHNLAAVNLLCQTCLWLEKGALKVYGPSQDVTAAYSSAGASLNGKREWAVAEAPGSDKIRLIGVQVKNEKGEATASIDIRFRFYIELHYRVLQHLPRARVGFWLWNSEGVILFEASDIGNVEWRDKARDPGSYVSRCEIPGQLLKAGTYLVTARADIPGIENLFVQDNAIQFQVEQTALTGAMANAPEKLPGVLSPSLPWEIQRL